MLLSIQQPEFFPWAGYFNKLAQCDRVVFLDNVQFKKRYFENRCRIKAADGMAWLTVPVFSKGQVTQRIDEVKVDNSKRWGAKTWSTLQQNYQKAPYWDQYSDFLEDTFAVRVWDRLVDLNLHVIKFVCADLGITVDGMLGSDLDLQADTKGSDLMLAMCRQLGADSYLSGTHGRDYLDDRAFAEAGIRVLYQDYAPPHYPQMGDAFVGPLSIMDLVLNNGADSINYIRGEAP